MTASENTPTVVHVHFNERKSVSGMGLIPVVMLTIFTNGTRGFRLVGLIREVKHFRGKRTSHESKKSMFQVISIRVNDSEKDVNRHLFLTFQTKPKLV